MVCLRKNLVYLYHVTEAIPPNSMSLLQTLQLHQLPVPPPQRHQLPMRPALHHHPPVNHINHIRLLNCA